MEDSIAPTATVRRTREIAFTQIDNELVAIDARREIGYALNESASQIWNLIATPMSVDAMCAELRKSYRVDERTCLRQVSAVLQKLRDVGLVQIGNDAIR